jgi:hypothetical protein
MKDAKGIHGCWEGCLVMWGAKTSWHLPTFYIAITTYVFNLEYWGCFIILTQNASDCEDMGTINWSNNYKIYGASSTMATT